MEKYRVNMEVVSTKEEVAAIQKKINQWITTKLLVKYKTTPMGNSVLFEICLKKES
jgi:hypothetical protein